MYLVFAAAEKQDDQNDNPPAVIAKANAIAVAVIFAAIVMVTAAHTYSPPCGYSGVICPADMLHTMYAGWRTLHRAVGLEELLYGEQRE